MNNNDFAKFIDEIRESRKMSREELVDGILSIRQYFRFIKGESSLKNQTISELLERLEIADVVSYEYFKRRNDDNFVKLKEIYQYVFKNDLKTANKMISDFDESTLELSSNKKFFSFIKEYLGQQQELWSYETAVQRVLDLIEYPDVLDKQVHSFVEKTALVYATNYLLKQKDFRISTYYYNLVKKEIDTKTHDEEYRIAFRVMAAKSLGYIQEFNKALYILKDTEQQFFKGIEFMPMITLYYYKALVERDMYDDETYKRSLRKMYCLINLLDDRTQTEKIEQSVERLFNIKEVELIQFK